jgi:endonuclease-3 related protein
MVGAVLTQNTAWTNVEKAIACLKAEGAMTPERIVAAQPRRLAGWIRSAGYFNVKARRLKSFCVWYLDQGGYDALRVWDTETLRAGLLSVNGVGPETADDILLYAFERPVFVIDAYTRRIFMRLGLVDECAGYETLRLTFESALRHETRGGAAIPVNTRRAREPGSGARRGQTVPPAPGSSYRLVALFNEYHALIVRHGKEVCRIRPTCASCALRRQCRHGRSSGTN